MERKKRETQGGESETTNRRSEKELQKKFLTEAEGETKSRHPGNGKVTSRRRRDTTSEKKLQKSS